MHAHKQVTPEMQQRAAAAAAAAAAAVKQQPSGTPVRESSVEPTTSTGAQESSGPKVEFASKVGAFAARQAVIGIRQCTHRLLGKP